MGADIGFTLKLQGSVKNDLRLLHGLKGDVLIRFDGDIEGVVIRLVGVSRFKVKSLGPRIDHYTRCLQVVHTKYARDLEVVDEDDVHGGMPVIENNHSLPMVLNFQHIAVG